MDRAKQANYPSLNGKSILVTGGASGIGEAIVEALAQQSAKIAFLDFQAEAGAALQTRLGEGVAFLPCDLRDIEALRAAIGEAASLNGPITGLVNNAARDDRHQIDEVTPDYWDERMATNLRHQFFAAQAVAPMMRERGGGSIVNMGSTSWMLGLGSMPAYTTAKSAVMGLTRGLARDFGPNNIRVNSIAPGWIMTERQKAMWLTPESEAALLERQCLKRHLTPDEIARVVLFLLADDSSCMTNQTYIADGGWL